MAMLVGDFNENPGMAKAIFDALEDALEETLEDAVEDGMPPEDLDKLRSNWQKLASAIATGVINHLKSNMEIHGIEASGPVTTDVTVTVGGAEGSGTGVGAVTTEQSGATTGHVR